MLLNKSFPIFSCVLCLILFHAVIRVNADCSWHCDNGQCIDSDDLCDGARNCADGSDETAENCIDKREQCPAVAFLCAYGGCITGKYKCNNITNCADGSDENPFLCAEDMPARRQALEAKLRGQCSASQMQCTNGKCIDRDIACDGHRDCDDGLDESVEICATWPCPTFAFRCGYGGCVRGNAKCDGTADCADASDEAAGLCKRKPSKPRPTNTTVDGCQIPYDRSNLIIADLNNIGKYLRPGDRVPSSRLVRFSCEAGYTRRGVGTTFCTSTGWDSEIPVCTKYCNSDLIHRYHSTIPSCTYKRGPTSCSENILPGTIAQIHCANGFDRSTQDFGPEYTELECRPDFQWNLNKITPCKMRCGIPTPETTSFTSGGIDIKISETPWHVGVYSNADEVSYKHICGGSIISPRIVLSAAHCFWDPATMKIYENTNYSVVAGNPLAVYNSAEGQKRKITEILVDKRYRDLSESYLYDLAVLTLDIYLDFTTTVSPICLRFEDLANQNVLSDISGYIVGWGKNSTDNREVLQRVDMDTLSYHDCHKQLKKVADNYDLPSDKFCVKSYDEHLTVCRGDSGGGFVTKVKLNDDTIVYRLMGIISHAPLKQQHCSRDGLVTLTNINFMKNLINGYFRNDVE